MVGATQSREQLSVRLVRIACFAVPVLVALSVVLLVGGVGGVRGRWLWAPAVAVPAMAAVGWWGRGNGRGRFVATVSGALSELALMPWNSQQALSHGRLLAAVNSLRVPPNFEHTGGIPGRCG